MIPDNEDRDDNKVYFFFTEKALEAENSAHTIYTRVGRLCAVRTASLSSYSCLLHTVYQAFCIQFYPCFYCLFSGFHTIFFGHISLPSLNSSSGPTPSLPIRQSVLQWASTLHILKCSVGFVSLVFTKPSFLCYVHHLIDNESFTVKESYL